MGRDYRILVEAASVGWRVSIDNLQPLMFLSGAKAEQYARDLAVRLGQLGGETEVTIRDPAKALVGADGHAAK
jgi:hypothetical protein